MATTFLESTPPPPSSIRTPTTPKFGYDDTYEPYSPRRKSARVSQRGESIHTPPRNIRASKKTSATDISSSPPSSPQTAPKKSARRSINTPGRRVSGALNFDNTATAAEALGIPTPTPRKMDRSKELRNPSFLPTPDKTPKRRPTSTAPAIKSVARNLFPVRGETADQAMPSPKKKGRKKYSGFSLDSFGAEDDPAIQIYTDSHDRVPEVDHDVDNPFYGAHTATTQAEPIKRMSKRRKIAIPGEGEQTIEEAEKREDGMVYVFRGKKVFRKFAEKADAVDHGSLANDSDDEIDTELDEAVPKNCRRHLTRSSIKPRLLFPSSEQVQARESRSQFTEDEEEAVTDIETDDNITSTPFDQINEVVTTPKAPKFAPASPPTTIRATRSRDIKMDSPAAISDGYSGASTSPFDSWRRTKHSPINRKRSGSPSVTRAGKKVRGSV